MKDIISISFFLILLGAFSCQSSGEKESSRTKESYTGKQYQKLAVVCVNEKRKIRKKFRKRIVRALKAKGIEAVSAKDIIPDSLLGEAHKDPEYCTKQLIDNGVDGLLAVFITKEKTIAKKIVDLKGEGVYWVGKFLYRRVVIDKKDEEVGVEEDKETEDQELLKYFRLGAMLYDFDQEAGEHIVWQEEMRIQKDSTTKAAAQLYADSLTVQLVELDKVMK